MDSFFTMYWELNVSLQKVETVLISAWTIVSACCNHNERQNRAPSEMSVK